MLAVKNYSQKYIDDSRLKVKSQISIYDKLIAASKKHAGENKALLNPAIEAFESVFFNNMVFVLDGYFVHRTRAIEGKDGNALNEVRVLCSSMIDNDNKMLADKTIKMNPAKSVLKYEVGDTITLSKKNFLAISEAFFAEIESKFL